VAPLVLPLIVLSQFGAVANAHFTIAWAIVSVLYMTMHLIISPFVAEVAAHPDKVAGLSRRMVQMTAAAALVGSVGLATAGPFALGLVGGEYREHGEGLLYLAALFIPLSAVSAVFEGFARAERKLGLIFAIRVTAAILIIGGSVVSTDMFGVLGVGWAYLSVEAVTAALLILPVIGYFRRNKRDPNWLARLNPPAEATA
jgi:O-antigen/teichoic acid export membrane protein